MKRTLKLPQVAVPLSTHRQLKRLNKMFGQSYGWWVKQSIRATFKALQ